MISVQLLILLECLYLKNNIFVLNTYMSNIYCINFVFNCKSSRRDKPILSRRTQYPKFHKILYG